MTPHAHRVGPRVEDDLRRRSAGRVEIVAAPRRPRPARARTGTRGCDAPATRGARRPARASAGRRCTRARAHGRSERRRSQRETHAAILHTYCENAGSRTSAACALRAPDLSDPRRLDGPVELARRLFELLELSIADGARSRRLHELHELRPRPGVEVPEGEEPHGVGAHGGVRRPRRGRPPRRCSQRSPVVPLRSSAPNPALRRSRSGASLVEGRRGAEGLEVLGGEETQRGAPRRSGPRRAPTKRRRRPPPSTPAARASPRAPSSPDWRPRRGRCRRRAEGWGAGSRPPSRRLPRRCRGSRGRRACPPWWP